MWTINKKDQKQVFHKILPMKSKQLPQQMIEEMRKKLQIKNIYITMAEMKIAIHLSHELKKVNEAIVPLKHRHKAETKDMRNRARQQKKTKCQLDKCEEKEII